jgi:hypothetical protein
MAGYLCGLGVAGFSLGVPTKINDLRLAYSVVLLDQIETLSEVEKVVSSRLAWLQQK